MADQIEISIALQQPWPEKQAPAAFVSPPPPDPDSSAERADWFAREVEPHEPALRAWLRMHYPRLCDVDDVLQECYLNLLRRRAGGRIVYAKAYLFTAARHAALKVFRKNRIYTKTAVGELPESSLLDADADVVDDVNVHEEDALVVEAIDRLPARCREIVLLRAVHGRSYAEIAAKLELSEPTVRVQVARGIKKCRQFLRDFGVDHSS